MSRPISVSHRTPTGETRTVSARATTLQPGAGAAPDPVRVPVPGAPEQPQTPTERQPDPLNAPLPERFRSRPERARSQPAPAAAPGSDWPEYADPGGRFRLRHPAHWLPETQDDGGVGFLLPADGWASIDLLDQPAPATLEELEQAALRELAGDDPTAPAPRVVARGSWPLHPSANFVEIRTRDHARDLNSRHVLVTVALGRAGSLLLGLGRRSGAVTEEERALAARIVAHLQVK